ncbi:MAG: hypothetical protein ACTHMD_20005 [Flavisolibacter sp.]
MKTIKQSMLVLAASFAATVSFAQVGLGVANSTHATVSKAVNVNATTQVAAHAATRVTNATKSTTSATTATAKSTLNKGSQTAAKAKSTAKENARVNAQADVHASEQAKSNANENSAVFGAKTDASSQADAGVNVDSKKALDKTEKTATKVKAKANNEARSNSPAALHARESDKELSNECSAVLYADAATS